VSSAPLSDDELPATGDPLQRGTVLARTPARPLRHGESLIARGDRGCAARGKEAGGDTFSAQERAMLRNILRFGKLTVEDVMVPRADIIAVEDSITVAELLRVFREAEHSRLPVYHETLDDPRGMIHIRDLMWITTATEKDGTLSITAVDLGKTAGAISIVREILYVPPSATARPSAPHAIARAISLLLSMNMAAPTASSPSGI
jgi:hypothetical protein